MKKQIKNINSLLKVKIEGQGGKKVDIVIKNNEIHNPFSIKYKNFQDSKSRMKLLQWKHFGEWPPNYSFFSIRINLQWLEWP